jgi:hypothetical protein
MPKRSVKNPNLPGPEFYLDIPCVSLCIPDMAMAKATGSGLQAEECEQLVSDTLHNFRPRVSLGFTMEASANHSAPATDIGNGAFPVPRGIVAYRTTHTIRMTRTQTPRADVPTITIDAGVATIANGPNTPGASVFYTLDGNYPCQFPTHGVASTLYAGPFAVESGQVVRAVAYYFAGGYQGSFGAWKEVP